MFGVSPRHLLPNINPHRLKTADRAPALLFESRCLFSALFYHNFSLNLAFLSNKLSSLCYSFPHVDVVCFFGMKSGHLIYFLKSVLVFEQFIFQIISIDSPQTCPFQIFPCGLHLHSNLIIRLNFYRNCLLNTLHEKHIYSEHRRRHLFFYFTR